MAIPKFDNFMLPVLECLADGEEHTLTEIGDFCTIKMALTDEDKAAKLEKSGQSIVYNRLSWAKTYLKKASLVENKSRGLIRITELGKTVLAQNPTKIDVKFLNQFKGFKDFHAIKPKGGDPEKVNLDSDLSPQEQIEKAIAQLSDSLADDLLEEVMKLTPTNFEHLVARLLMRMGYGELKNNKDAVTQPSNDGGIDGIVKADKLGFDFVVIQAKKWDINSTVGAPEIQKFLGACAGQGANKGLFITTARFSAKAIEYANKQLTTKLVLIDGEAMTRLMMEYNLGVAVASTYEIKRIDSDFFSSEF